MKAARRTLVPAKDILLGLFRSEEPRLAEFLLSHAYFISPDRIRKRWEGSGTAAWFPDCVRTSREHHGGKQRKDASEWQGKAVRVWDNTKARLAFAAFTSLVMAGDKEDRIRGYHVAHIWERVYDPACFTAGWNLCLMPGFLKLFTEQQDRIALLQQVAQQAAFDLSFSEATIGMATPEFVIAPGLDLNALFPGLVLNLL